MCNSETMYFNNGDELDPKGVYKVVKPLQYGGMTVLLKGTCYRCGGTGFLPFSAYGGVCFLCHGQKVIVSKRRVFTAKKLARLNQLKDEKNAGHLAKVEAKLEAYVLDNPICETVFAMREQSDFLGSLAGALDRYGQLTPNQLAAVPKAIEYAKEAAVRQANKDAENAGREFIGRIKERREFTGTVVFTKVFEGMFGPSRIVKLEDEAGDLITYMGSSEDLQDVEQGDTVTMTATIKKHEDYQGEKQTQVNRPAKITVTQRN